MLVIKIPKSMLRTKTRKQSNPVAPAQRGKKPAMARALVNTAPLRPEAAGNYHFSPEFLDYIGAHLPLLEKEMPNFGVAQLAEMRQWSTAPTPLLELVRWSPTVVRLARRFGLEKCGGIGTELDVLAVPAPLRRFVVVRRACGTESATLRLNAYWTALCRARRADPAAIVRNMDVAMRCAKKIRKYY